MVLVISETVSTSEKCNGKNKKLNIKQQYIEHNEAVPMQECVGSAVGAVSAAVVGRGVSLALSIFAISPAASGAAIVLDLVSINYITVNLVN